MKTMKTEKAVWSRVTAYSGSFYTKRRMIFLTALMAATAVFFCAVLFVTQIINGDSYALKQSSSRTYTVPVEAPRGNILDSSGQKMAYNSQSNELLFDASAFPPSSRQGERNAEILTLIQLLERRGEKWEDNLPIYIDASGNMAFKEDADGYVKWLRSSAMLDLNDYATARNCYDAINRMYSLGEYSETDALKIGSVLCNMVLEGYSVKNPYVFANGVSSDTVAYIKENSSSYPGVEAGVYSVRSYADGTLAPHIIGSVGVIDENTYKASQTELEQQLSSEDLSSAERLSLQRRAYNIDSVVGKSGVESLFEDELRGEDGEKTITVSSDGAVSEVLSVLPRSGYDVKLNINMGLQKAVQSALNRHIRELAEDQGLSGAGAAVVMNVNSGAVLASATYPNFNLTTYTKDYNKLAAEETAPLWNRVLQSTYAPGSTMKPAMAIAALETGEIDEDTAFFCDGVFEYKGSEFGCLNSHGYLTVRAALNHSCNIFFYNVGDRLGITKMNTYCTMLGLGSKTGCELPEASGVLAGVAYRSSIGATWLPGDTIQAAIGQSDNLFTPLQLCNYVATIANGGTRYVPHYISSVTSHDGKETLLETHPEVALQTGFSEKNLTVVREGMWNVANIGTCRDAFSILPEEVAAKTGTSQVIRRFGDEYYKGNNGFIITFGPYEEPEIAIAVVIEYIDSGSATAQLAADIYDYYFAHPEINGDG